MMNFSKELLNQNRVLQISHNRQGNYLMIDLGRDKTIIMVVKRIRDITDIILIKEFNIDKNINDTIDRILDICFEFNIINILIDSNGMGMYVYDSILEYIKSNSKYEYLKIIKVSNAYGNKNNIIVHITDDIKLGKLRLLQTTNCAKNSYIKPFLGYSEIINSHRETDNLINEMDNIELSLTDNGCMKIKYKDSNISHSRVNCLFVYYSNLCNEENK